jgi:hypothetical protein
MKLKNFELFILLLLIKTTICLKAKIDQSLFLSPDSQTNLIEMKLKNKGSVSLSNSLGRRYKSSIVILHQKETLVDVPFQFNGEVEPTKQEINIYENGKINRKFSYIK